MEVILLKSAVITPLLLDTVVMAQLCLHSPFSLSLLFLLPFHWFNSSFFVSHI